MKRILACIAGAAFFSSSPAQAAQPWDSAFQTDTRAILEASSRIASAGQPQILVLLEDHHYLVHSDGRTDTTVHKVYRVEQNDAVEQWSSIEQVYQPWYQEKPELKGRVINKDGSVQWLDTKTIADAPARQLEFNIFSDQRALRAPFPGVVSGCIVEYEIVIREKATLLDAGVVRRLIVAEEAAIEHFHVLVESEPGINLQKASQLISESALRWSSTARGTRLECDLTGIVPKDDFEWNGPSDIPVYPYLVFSTGKSWQAVAERYEKIVDQRIQAADLKGFLEGIDLSGKPADMIPSLVARLHKTVRYTGVEFGEAAIMPGTPGETIQRGYGDCKDKAALLVAMLRAAGLKAYLALLEAGTGPDVDRDLPGIGIFNHAIVYVGSDPPLWIDATASDTRVGFLPPPDQGRLALIADQNTSALVKTPEAQSGENWEHTRVDVRMSEFGDGAMTVSNEVNGGSREPILRAALGAQEKKSREQIENWVKQSSAGTSLGNYEVMRRDDMSGPFRMSLDAIGSRMAMTGLDEAVVALEPRSMFQRLPWALTRVDPDVSKEPKPREHEFVFQEPYQMQLDYVIHPPALFKVSKVPSSDDTKLGTATFSKHFEKKADGTVEAHYRFDSGKRRLTPPEFSAFRAALKEYSRRVPEIVAFVPETTEYVALGEINRAASLLRERIVNDPKSSMLHVRFSNVLAAAGLGDAALEEAKTAVRLDSASAYAWSNLGGMFEHDSLGRLRRGDWNYAEAEKALRKALDIDAKNDGARLELAILLEFNAQGWRYATGARMAEAIALYRELAAKPQHQAGIDQNLAVALVRTGKFDEAKELLRKLSGEIGQLLLDAILAVEEGPARVMVRAQAAYPDTQQRAIHLGMVAQGLAELRHYETAAAMMKAAARLVNAGDVQARAEVLGKLKRWEDAILPEEDPRSLVQRMMLDAFRGSITLESVQALASKRLSKDVFAPDVRSMQRASANARQILASGGVEQEMLLDWMVSLLELEKTGDDEHGYRIRAMPPGTASAFTIYLVREDGKYRILGTATSGWQAVGALVLELLQRNDVKGAQWWLDQVVRDAEARPDRTGRPAVTGLWSDPRSEMRGPAAIRVAAAALIGGSTGSATALATLEEARVHAHANSA